MAEEEDFDLEVQKTETKTMERPTRRIDLLQHDTSCASTEEMVEHVQQVLDAMSPEASHKDVAAKLKRRLDSSYGGTWHVIVGKHFGANVTNDRETLINVKIDGVYYLAMRSGPPERQVNRLPEDEVTTDD